LSYFRQNGTGESRKLASATGNNSRLFVTIGAGRQADLVKIVAGFATPFAG
jgi:glycerol dehydrogenase-like iron-containing ADH family enzyme